MPVYPGAFYDHVFEGKRDPSGMLLAVERWCVNELEVRQLLAEEVRAGVGAQLDVDAQRVEQPES